jgi:peptidoglycan/xylan/chitin deacetylase (PgdA/CDA1 family)
MATALVAIAGFALISPLFFRYNAEPKPRVMLGFSILPAENVESWCEELSRILDSHNIEASVFFTGQAAEKSPQSVSGFSSQIDIGSQTYSNADLTRIADYSLKLQEVQKGKQAVDKAGNLYTQIFRAPFGATDPDTYSLLTRSDIRADFSYDRQYNVFRQGQFIWFEALVFEGGNLPSDINQEIDGAARPVIVFFDNTQPVSLVEAFLSGLKLNRLEFINASELTGMSLTGRGVENGGSGITPD